MSEKKKSRVVVNWSGGKDSALALHHILKSPNFEVESLFTTLNGKHRRISMHGVSEELLNRQMDSLGLPLKKLFLPEQPNMYEYNEAMDKAWADFRQQGITHSVYGDIFLEDLRQYRDAQLKTVGIHGLYLLWKEDTRALMTDFLGLGYKTVVVSINADLLDKSFCGRVVDDQFLKDLPKDIDPCGENGEFHTFVFDGPIFDRPVDFSIGKKIHKTYPSPVEGEEEVGFWFCELLD